MTQMEGPGLNDEQNAKKRKRHCMVVYAQYPLGETRVQREAEALIANGYDVDVICFRRPNQPAVDVYQGVHIYRESYRLWPLKRGGLIGRFLNYLRFFFNAQRRLNQLHRQHPYTTVQTHNLPDFLVFCAYRQKRQGVPVILDLHDLMPEFYAGRFGVSHGGLARLVRWQERAACRFADHVITVSEHWRQALIARGTPPEKVSVVMNVADDKIFHMLPEGPPLRVSDGTFHLIYHGTVVYRYGLDLAIRAVEQLRTEIPGLRLTILGKGDAIPDLVQLTQTLGLTEQVAIRNELRPAEELPGIIRTADVGIVPYRNDVFSDGLLPTKLMEYAAVGLPAIASRTTAIQAYFGDTMTELFEPNSVEDLVRCIRTLYHDQARRQALAEGCQRFNERYSWSRIGAEYVALVERLRQTALSISDNPNAKFPES